MPSHSDPSKSVTRSERVRTGRRRRRDWPEVVVETTRSELRRGELSDAGIWNALQREAARPNGRFKPIDVPSVATIGRWRGRSDVQPPAAADPADRWTIGAARAEDDVPFVLDVFRGLLWRYGGSRRFVTNDEALWLSRIHRAAPDLGPDSAWVLARAYISRTDGPWDDPNPADLDYFLAFAPWRDEDHAKIYRRATHPSFGYVRRSQSQGTDEHILGPVPQHDGPAKTARQEQAEMWLSVKIAEANADGGNVRMIELADEAPDDDFEDADPADD